MLRAFFNRGGGGSARYGAFVARSTATSSPSSKINFYTSTEEELKTVLVGMGQPSFRAKQIRQWVYDKGVLDFSDMKDLPLPLRTQLSSVYAIGALHLASEQVSKPVSNVSE